ncbi:MAG: hypothetical protein U0K81_04745 [Paludibacteraceae bacterium]|nr:hypothetical protein [Paludibacteraceae bacterium]
MIRKLQQFICNNRQNGVAEHTAQRAERQNEVAEHTAQRAERQNEVAENTRAWRIT